MFDAINRIVPNASFSIFTGDIDDSAVWEAYKPVRSPLLLLQRWLTLVTRPAESVGPLTYLLRRDAGGFVSRHRKPVGPFVRITCLFLLILLLL